MADIYQTFLKAPSAAALAPDAALHYITTTTSIHEPAAIVKHLQAQDKQVEKKSENVISVTESSSGACLETETTFLFKNGGGAILPQMDSNMLSDAIAVCPMVHIVQFDANRKITQIRLYWDQSTMLKQVDAIGKTGRNWPIKDGSMQTKLVANSVKAAGSQQPHHATAAAAPSHHDGDVVITSRAQDRPQDRSQARPQDRSQDYNSRLFATDEDQPGRTAYTGPSVDARVSAKPRDRNLNELIGNEDTLAPTATSAARSPSPAKTGAGKNFPENRVFGDNMGEERRASPERKQASPRRYDHFEFGDGENASSKTRNPPPGLATGKHVKQWDFEDTNTPPKPTQGLPREQERHIGFGYDEPYAPSPEKRPIVHTARPSSNPHFAMTDVDSPAPPVRANGGRPGINDSHIGDAPSAGEAGLKQPLSAITNVNNGRRGQDLKAHFSMADKAPTNRAPTENTDPNAAANARNMKNAGRDETESHWSFESSPIQDKKIYKTAGDGMGGRAGSRLWSIGDEGEDELYGQRGGTKQVYNTAGNGMGGRKDAGRQWSIGDDSVDNFADLPSRRSAGRNAFA